jgi:hypothetical protein
LWGISTHVHITSSISSAIHRRGHVTPWRTGRRCIMCTMRTMMAMAMTARWLDGYRSRTITSTSILSLWRGCLSGVVIVSALTVLPLVREEQVSETDAVGVAAIDIRACAIVCTSGLHSSNPPTASHGHTAHGQNHHYDNG